MRRSVAFVMTCILMCPLSIARAGQDEPVQPVSVDLAITVERTLATSEALQIKKNDAQKTYQVYREAKSTIFPRVSGAVGLTRNLDYTQDPFGMMQDYEAGYGVEASQLLWSFGKVSAAIKAADRALQASTLEEQSSRQDIVRSAKDAYFTALLAQETLAVVKGSYENTLANKRLLEERTAGGRASQRDNIKIDADIAARVPVQSRAQAQTTAALATLKSRMGLALDQPVTLRERFSEEYAGLSYPALEYKLLNDEPTLKALDRTVEFRDYAAQAQKGDFYPEIAGFAGWRRQGASYDWPIGNNDLDDNSLVGVKMSVPIWTGGQTQSRLERARIETRNARLQRAQTGKDLTVALYAAVSEYQEQVKTLQANTAALKLSEESFRLNRELFASGQVSAADLNDAELLFTSQRLGRLQTLYTLNILRARIEQLTNSGEAGL